MPYARTKGSKRRAAAKAAKKRSFHPYRRKLSGKRKALLRAKGRRKLKRKAGAVVSKSWKQKVNKVAKRVLTSMNDDKAVMYRQFVPKDATVTSPTGTTWSIDSTTPLANGDWVQNNNSVMRAILRREKQGFFQIEAFRGMVAPSWGDLTLGEGDNNFGKDIGQTHHHDAGAVLNDRLDIRAFKEVELPLIPCIPKYVENAEANFKEINELGQFCRSGDKIKITNNYMRFRFFATKNGHIKRFNVDTHTMQNPTTTVDHPHGKLMMCGLNNNVKVTRTAGSLGTVYETETLTTQMTPYNFAASSANPATFGSGALPGVSGQPTPFPYLPATRVDVSGTAERRLVPNTPISYEITARRFAKVRIIVWERECFMKQPVQLHDFMRYHGGTNWSNEFHYGSEELHNDKRFYSKKKTKRDLPFFADTNELETLMKGKFIVDKVINLPMGREKTVILNPLKGKVLEYDPNSIPKNTYTDEGVPIVTTIGGDHNENAGIPLSTNHVTLTDPDHNALIEYVPINKQYGMFMLFNVQRAGVEYDVFQKFEYDK